MQTRTLSAGIRLCLQEHQTRVISRQQGTRVNGPTAMDHANVCCFPHSYILSQYFDEKAMTAMHPGPAMIDLTQETLYSRPILIFNNHYAQGFLSAIPPHQPKI